MSINYTKLYFVILAAILSASLITSAISNLSYYLALKEFQSYFISKFKENKPSIQHSATLQRDLDRLTQPPQKKELTAAEKQKKAAKENDIILCKFWTDQYKKDNLPASNLHRKTSCSRAHAK